MDLSSPDVQLIILDAQISPSLPKIKFPSRSAPLSIVVLALSDPQALQNRNHPDLERICRDFIIKNNSPGYLLARVGFYIDYLRNINGDITADLHEMTKQNRSLIEQVAHLQKQLTQVDSDLHVRAQVLDKISQITQLSRQINCLNLESVASVCIDQIPLLISARFASLYQFDEDTHLLHLLQHNHPYTIDDTVPLQQNTDSPMALAIKHKQLLIIKDFAQLPGGQDQVVHRLFARNYQSNSCIIAPLLSGQNVLGVLNLADKIDAPFFDKDSDLPPVQLLCEIIGSAISNIKLYDEVRQRARTDSMTGLVNHRIFYNELDKEVHRSQRYGNGLSLIMIDLDNLKEINDTFGHRAGDAVLLHLADRITQCIRDIDIAARYGGDEFAIILPSTSLSDALIVARRLMKMVAEEPVRADNNIMNVSISIGLGQYHSPSTTQEFMNESDSALLQAKSAGRNRIHVAEFAKK